MDEDTLAMIKTCGLLVGGSLLLAGVCWSMNAWMDHKDLSVVPAPVVEPFHGTEWHTLLPIQVWREEP